MAASDRPAQAAAAIEALGESPSPSDARRELAEFDAKDLAAALVSRGGGGGGGFTPARNVGQALFDVSVTSATLAVATVAYNQGDAGLVDLTSPTAPKPVAAGSYAFMVFLQAQAPPGNTPILFRLDVDDDWYSAHVFDQSTSSEGYLFRSFGPWYCDAASPFAVYAGAADNEAAAVAITGSLWVQRVT